MTSMISAKLLCREAKMSEANKTLVRRVVDEIWTGANSDLIESYYAEDFRCHFEPGDDWIGRAGVRERYNQVHQLLDDFEERIDDLVASGDRVAARTMVSGVYRDRESGSTRKISTLGVLIYRISDGQIAEQWEVANVTGIVAQLGIEATPSGG